MNLPVSPPGWPALSLVAAAAFGSACGGQGEGDGGGAAGAGGGPGTGATSAWGGSGTGADFGAGGSPAGGASSGGTAPGGTSAGAAPSGGAAGGGASSGGASSGGGAGAGGQGVGGQGVGGAQSTLPGSSATVEGRQLLLGGVPFRIRGVNWNPVPVGGTHPANLDFAGYAATDIPLMAEAGINVVRTYERLDDVEVLDQLHAAGIYVFSTVYGWWQDDPSVVVERVSAVKDHPAILAWVLGNEWNYNQLYSDGQLNNDQARDLINQAAALIKSVDADHPIATIHGELADLDVLVGQMPDIDLWGINSYRGLSHGDLFVSYASVSSKPMFLGEYGSDAYNALIDAVDLQSQADATRELTLEIIDNYVTEQEGTTCGGFVFEFADEWWKDGAGSPNVQDVGGIAPGGGPYPDQTFNEEYWGLVDIQRNPRPAYEELKALYGSEGSP